LHGLNWALAVRDAEKGDFAPLIKLLRADPPEPPTAESWPLWQGMLNVERQGRLALAELLSRSTRLVKKRGGQTTPMFNLSAQERLRRAADAAIKLKGAGMSGPDAISKAAEVCEVDPEKLRRDMDGKIGWGRRKKSDG
jgi:hypothetical protein